MTSVTLAWGTAFGMALGLAYAVSPLTVWFAVVMIGLFVWAGRGLSDRERRYVWSVLAVAVAIRVYAIAALFVTSHLDPSASFFWDGDGVYLKQRAVVIRNLWTGLPLYPEDVFHAFDRSYGWSPYIYLLAYLEYLTRPDAAGAHLLNVALFVAAAIVMHRLVRTAYGRAPALFGLALMLLLPTLIAWSIAALKESVCVFLFVLGFWAAVTAIRAAGMADRLFGFAVLAGAIAANGALRPGMSSTMIAGLGSGLAGHIIVRRVSLVLLAVVCLPLAAASLWQYPVVQAKIMAQLKTSARLHLGSLMTEGYAYKLLDEGTYSEHGAGIATMTPGEGLRFAVRAFAGFVIAPLPWQIPSRSGLAFLPQQLVWYILVALACVGLPAGLRRDTLVTCMLAGLTIAVSAAIALNSGNIGTMVRFRDWIVPFVVWLSALGATSLVSRIMTGERGTAFKTASA
jgi:hypothetical protein